MVVFQEPREVGLIPVFVISLERSVERRAKMKARLDALGIPFSFVDAIDGAAGHPTVRSRLLGRDLRPAEIGCYLSHTKALNMMLSANAEYSCILEDDADLSNARAQFFDQSACAALPSFDILRLVAEWSGRSLHAGNIGNVPIHAPLRRGMGSLAQIYSRAGAAKIAKTFLPIREPVDVHLYFDPPTSTRILDVAVAQVTSDGSVSITNPNRPAEPPRNWALSRIHRTTYKYRRLSQFIAAWGPKACLKV